MALDGHLWINAVGDSIGRAPVEGLDCFVAREDVRRYLKRFADLVGKGGVHEGVPGSA